MLDTNCFEIKTEDKVRIFKLKELQILIEEEIKGRNPCSSVNEVKKEICALSMRIVEQVTKDLAAKYQINKGKIRELESESDPDELLRNNIWI